MGFQRSSVERYQEGAGYNSYSAFSIRCVAMTTFAIFDASDYLTGEETIAEHLTVALEDPNPDMFLVAVRDVTRARGMTQLAKDSGLGRESLYKALSPGSKLRHETIQKIISALGAKLSATALRA